MQRTSGWILASGLILGGAGLAVGQMFPPTGGMTGQMPPEMAEMQKAQERLMKDVDPELYAFQTKQRIVNAKIEKITTSFAKKEIDKETARESMLPLIKEQQELQNDPEFLVEQRLAQAYFSSPEFQKKMKEVMAKFAAARKGGRP